MVRARSAGATGKPAFVWQALLISVPVFVLAVIGFFSLQQDRAIARHEAAERAREIAQDVLARFSFALTNESSTLLEPFAGVANPERFAFETAPSGELVYPPSYNRDAAPAPLEVAELAPEPGRLWGEFQRLEVSGAPTAARLKACRKFIDARPLPKRFWPVTGYSMGLLLMESGEWQEAVREFERVVSQFPEGIGESGLPLAPLCRLRLLEISQSGTQALSFSTPVSAETVLREAVLKPTVLSQYLIRRVGEEATNAAVRDLARDYQSLWNEHERTRRCYSAWPQPTAATNVQSWWLRFGEEDLVATVLPAGSEPPAHIALQEDWLGRIDPVRAMMGSAAEIRGSASAPRNNHSARVQSPIAPAAQADHSVIIEGQVASESPPPGPTQRMISDLGYRWVVCISESELGRLFSSVVQNRKGTPDYFGLGLEIAGKRVLKFAPQVRPWHQIYYGGKGGGSKKEYLDESKVDALVFPQPEVVGSATGDTGSRGPSPHPGDLKVMVFLTSPETLFERQTTRSFWFGCLIASASVAAAIGLAAAWRAFSRQHQLAEMKTNFVSSVSHELRAPIASIRLLAESLEKGKVQAAQKQNDYFRFIGQECRRLSSLIENVLDFSRIEQGRKEYNFEPTDVQSLVRDTVALMQTYANEKEVRIDLTIAPEMAALKDQPSLDGRAIQQALVNLIDNAVKHSPANGAVQVGVGRGAAREDARPIPKTARGDARPTTEQALVISVEDHGPGIPAAEHEKIFERFYRTGSELRRESQGVGIGLSLVKHIVEAHGGKVRVRSVVGEGSVFTIEVPIGKPE